MELLLLVAEWLSEPARCALASTSRQLQATTSALFVGHASLRTSVLFRRPFTANVHYRADVARIAELLHSRRFSRLQRLHLVVASPALLPGGPLSQPPPSCPPWCLPPRPLKSLRLSLPLCQRFPSVRPAVGALTRLIAPWAPLQSLTLEGVPNLCVQHLAAMCRTHVRALVLRDCRCTAALRKALTEGAIDGRLFPPTVDTLELGLLDLPATLARVMTAPAPVLLLSAMPRLACLTLQPEAERVFACAFWYCTQTMQALRTLQRLDCHSLHACVAIAIACPGSTCLVWRSTAVDVSSALAEALAGA